MKHHRGAVWVALASLVFAFGAGAEDADDGFSADSFDIEGEGYGDDALRERLMTPTNEIELGVRWSSEGDLFYRNYAGIPDDFSVLGNVDLEWRDPWDSGDTRYVGLEGLNLGLDSRFLRLEHGRQGTYSGYLLFRELPTTDTDSAKQYFDRMPGNYLELPGGWVAGDEADAAPLSDSIDANLRGLNINRKRRIFGGGFELDLPEGFDFEANSRHEDRMGELLTGAVIGYSGGNPRAVVVPDKIDWQTTNYDATLRYTDEDFQLQVGYVGSRFENDANPLLWDNPFLADGDWNPAAGFPTGQGQMGHAPDNWFHQLQASGGVNLPYQTRVTLNTAFGWMLQDDSFLPYTVNPAIAVPVALPRSSLDGEIFSTLVNFRVASRPLPKLRLDLDYRYENRDNDTPRNTYLTVGGDSEDQPAVDEDGARINRPYSFEIHHALATAGYEILPRTHFTIGGEWERVERDYQEVNHTNDYSLLAGLRSRPCSTFSGRVDYSHSWRDASSYVGTRPLVNGETPEALVGFDPDTDWENHPLLKKYNMADRERDEVRSSWSWMALEDLTVGLSSSYARDDYDDTVLGLTKSSTLSSGIDLSWTPLSRFSTHAFYSFDRIKADQAGWSTRGFAKLADAANVDRRWWVDHDDQIHTVGAGVRIGLIPDKLDLNLDYLFTHATGEIDVQLGSALAGGGPTNPSYPDLVSRVHDVRVTTTYQLTQNWSFKLAYLFEDFDSDDWQVAGVTPTTLTEVIASGQRAAGYQAHVVTWSVIYRFWKWPGS